jgi:hypothetical protein
MNTEGTRKRGSVWSTAAVIVGIVAAGTVVAGLLNDPQSDAISIPGCDEVIQPEEMERVNYAFAGGGDVSDAWLTEAKAEAMSDALVQSLPAGTVVEPDPSWPPLVFDSSRNGVSETEASAVGLVTVDGEEGPLGVRVVRSGEGPGPCFANFVDERRTVDDGIVLDVSRGRVIAYVPDGSEIDVSGDVFTVDQLIAIATDPGLRVGTPVSTG